MPMPSRALRPASRTFITMMALTFLAILGGPALAEDMALKADAERIHAAAITVDTHVDIPTFFASDRFDMGQINPSPAQVDLPRMEEGGLDAAFFIVYVRQTKRDPVGYAQAVSTASAKFAAIHRLASGPDADRVGLALTADDVRTLHANGKRAALIGIENGYVIGTQIDLLDTYYDWGARYFGLVHNGHNDIGDSAQPRLDLADDPALHGGLSAFGRDVVRRCNRLGIMIDVSHASKQTTLDAIKQSRAPVIASHSSVKGVFEHPRNMSDEELKALAAKGGVVQIVAFDTYLKTVTENKKQAFGALRKQFPFKSLDEIFGASPAQKSAYSRKLRSIQNSYPRASVSDLVDHIDYAVKLVGVDHVGISSDFQGGGGIDGWNNAAESINVTIELVKRGYTEQDIKKIWGGNLLRVMAEVDRKKGGFLSNFF